MPIARDCPAGEVHMVDKDFIAVEYAKKNAELNGLTNCRVYLSNAFGAVGDVRIEVKHDVLERLISEHDLSGRQLVTFGDGPVEIRETRKRGGLAVGLASDEVRRFGLNPVKRARLIRAGADLIVPDFSQIDKLLALLKLAT